MFRGILQEAMVLVPLLSHVTESQFRNWCIGGDSSTGIGVQPASLQHNPIYRILTPKITKLSSEGRMLVRHERRS